MNLQERLVVQECLGDCLYQAFEDLDLKLSSKSQELIYTTLSSVNVINEDYVVKNLIYRIISSDLANLVLNRYRNDSSIKSNKLFDFVSLNVYSQYITVMNYATNLVKGEDYAKNYFYYPSSMHVMCEQAPSERVNSSNDRVCGAGGQDDWSNVTFLDSKRIKDRKQ